MTREEAIKIVRKMLRNIYQTDAEKKALAVLIPELAESEDERIRKFLIDILSHGTWRKEWPFGPNEVVAYLEKQKDNQYFIGYANGYSDGQLNPKQKEPNYTKRNELFDKCVENCDPEVMKEVSDNVDKMLEPKIAFGDWGDKEKKEAIITCLQYMRFIKKITNQEYDDLMNWLDNNLVYNALKKKQKEQKPSDMPPGFYFIDLDGKKFYSKEFRYGDMKMKVVENEKEQKPYEPKNWPVDKDNLTQEQEPVEWSEDFEENIRTLLHNKLTWHSEDGSMSSTVFIDDKTLKDIVYGIWFYVGKEALKYPNKEIHVQEWSEEDKKMICSILDNLRRYQLSMPNFQVELQMKWLKSLRPAWKPSEEQIYSLGTVIKGMGDVTVGSVGYNLKELYEQLKKL